MKQIAILFMIVVAATEPAQAAPVNETDAIALGKKLCAAQLPKAGDVHWLAHFRGVFWEVIGSYDSKDVPRSVSVLVPVEGDISKAACGRRAVRIAI